MASGVGCLEGRRIVPRIARPADAGQRGCPRSRQRAPEAGRPAPVAAPVAAAAEFRAEPRKITIVQPERAMARAPGPASLLSPPNAPAGHNRASPAPSRSGSSGSAPGQRSPEVTQPTGASASEPDAGVQNRPTRLRGIPVLASTCRAAVNAMIIPREPPEASGPCGVLQWPEHPHPRGTFNIKWD